MGRYLNWYLSKEDVQLANNHLKSSQPHYSSRKVKFHPEIWLYTQPECLLWKFEYYSNPQGCEELRKLMLLVVNWYNSEKSAESTEAEYTHSMTSQCPSYIPSRNVYTCASRDMYKMFIAATLTIVRSWNSSRCLSVIEWINKLCYLHTIEELATATWKRIL